MIKYFFILFVFLNTISTIAQTGSVSGKVTDDKGQPLIGVNVIVKGTILGTATDSKGNFTINKMRNGNYQLVFSMVGFSKKTSDKFIINNDNIVVNAVLSPTSYQYDQLIISAGKHEQNLNEISASTYLIDAKKISQKNYQKIDDAFRYVPGVTMTLDQVSIRGSSGYSRGAGTRVLIALDGIPIYTPDTGEIIWELVPISDVGKVEVIKGSASSLYGSSALGGVINIISKKITSNPITLVKLQGSIYSKPSFKEWEWTDKTLYYNHQTISHSMSIGKFGFSASISRFEDLSYRQNEYQLRFSGFIKANYSFSEFTTLSMLGAGFTRNRGTFVFWQDLAHALSPPETDLGQSIKSDRTILGMNFKHIFNEELSLNIIPSVYISFWDDESESDNKSNSTLFRTEARVNYVPTDKITIITGSEFQFNKIASTIFGDRLSNGIGAYTQVDYKIITPLNITAGLRYDYNKLSDLRSESSFSPKIGLNYKIDENTYLRTSFSKGFRSPSLAEAFTSTTTSGITVKPNPELKAENSYSIEAGVKHYFSENFNIDFALFNNEYFDMIEPRFDPRDGELFFDNVTRARIQGFEFNTTSAFFSQSVKLNIGYSYLWARDVEKNTPLKYRPRHSVVAGIDFSKSVYEFGFDFRYLSKVEKIDDELIELGLVPDGDKIVEIIVMDARIGANLFAYNIPLRVFLNAKNVLNYNYVEMIGNIAPIRNFSLNLEFFF